MVPYLLTGAGPNELFIVRNAGAFVPPYDDPHGLHGTMATVEPGHLTLQGWHDVIEAGEVQVFDTQQGGFVPASIPSHSGTAPYQPDVEHDGQIISD